MVDIKRITIVGAALFSAATIGLVMQSGDDANYRSAQLAAPSLTGTKDAPLEVTDITLTSAVAETEEAAAPAVQKPKASDASTDAPKEEVQVAALDNDVVSDALPVEAAPEPSCEISMTAEPMIAAMAKVELTAQCLPNERVTLHHNGMMFTDATDAEGKLTVDVPALTKNAIIIAAFANGEGALASVAIDDLDQFDRKVVQSKANAHLNISAYEFGAEFRDEGHITAEADRTAQHAQDGAGGFITRLGDASVGESLVAEIYTFPTTGSKAAGDIAVVVEAEVTTDNCGLRIDAQTLEVELGGRLKVQDLTLPIPACDAVGDFLVLQNLLGDLKVARN